MRSTTRSSRPDRDAFFMALAVLTSTRGTCPRRMVGALLVQDGVLRGTGYNGAPAGMEDCLEIGCSEDASGHCVRAIHAEANVILTTDVVHRRGATVYCTDMPCLRCANMIANSGVTRVVWTRIYASHADQVRELFDAKGIELVHYPLPLSSTGELLPPEPTMRSLGLKYTAEQLRPSE